MCLARTPCASLAVSPKVSPSSWRSSPRGNLPDTAADWRQMAPTEVVDDLEAQGVRIPSRDD